MPRDNLQINNKANLEIIEQNVYKLASKDNDYYYRIVQMTKAHSVFHAA